MDLDEQLKAAAPAVTTRTPQLRVELDALVAASEADQRPRRRRARVAVVGSAVAAVLGLGTVASATGILPGWTMWTTSGGQTCGVQVWADLLPPGAGEPVSATFSLAEQQATLVAAQAFLADFDYGTVDPEDAIASWQTEERRVRAAQPDPAERQPKLEGDELEIQAVTRVVVEQMRTELGASGHDIRAVGIWSANGCSQ